MHRRIAQIGLLILVSMGALPVQAQQEYYERETSQHLGNDRTSYFSILQIVKNGTDPYDATDRVTYRDSTFLVRRANTDSKLLEKTLLRAERRVLYYDIKGVAQFRVFKDYVIKKKSEDLLPEEFVYAVLGNPYWPCWIDFKSDGLYLAYTGEQEQLLRPLTEFGHLFPEYTAFLADPRSELNVIEGYSGPGDWYYLSFSPGCMTEPTGTCRQVVVPVPKRLLLETRDRFVGKPDN